MKYGKIAICVLSGMMQKIVSMKKKIKKVKYTDEAIEARVVNDFLPKPEELFLREDNVKVTLSLSRKSIDFFKDQADKLDTPYQSMIRALLDKYTENFA